MQRRSMFWAICGCALVIAGALLIFADQQTTRPARQTWKLFLDDLRAGNLVAANQKCDPQMLRVIRTSNDRYRLVTRSGGNWLSWPHVKDLTVAELEASFSYAPPAPRLYLGDSVPIGPKGSVWHGHLAIAGGRVTFVKSRSSLVEVVSDWMTPRAGC